ncbi:ATP-binding protein [Vibrio sp. WJH972]
MQTDIHQQKKTIRSRLEPLVPRSLVSRMLWLTLLSVFIAQLIATTIWYTQSKQKEMEGLRSTATSIANNFASTANFFQSLPHEYRHIILDQLRTMGGTRFFVSFNTEEILINSIETNEMRESVIQVFREVLTDKSPGYDNIMIHFSDPDNLHVLSNDLLLSDLPKSWAHYTLSLKPLKPPILVVQIELAPEQWLYIAALLPSPYSMLDDTIISTEQLFFIGFITALLLIFTYLMVRMQIRPLRKLASAADSLSMDIDQDILPEEGASELVTATRAFNRMQLRLQCYITDREKLFSAISHDLKTPITRLRIRSELIEDEQRGVKFSKDLDELEIMVKGALQAVRDTDIHENIEFVNIMKVLQGIAEQYNENSQRVYIHPAVLFPVSCKPLAIKRCLSNLINNGVKYGNQVTISFKDSPDTLEIVICDEGPGIPEDMMAEVFKPYVRIATDKEGHGLGMGISKSIVRAHGGELTIRNRDKVGLQVRVSLPRTSAN